MEEITTDKPSLELDEFELSTPGMIIWDRGAVECLKENLPKGDLQSLSPGEYSDYEVYPTESHSLKVYVKYEGRYIGEFEIPPGFWKLADHITSH